MPELEVIRKTVPAMTIAAIRVEIPTNDQVGDLLPKAFDDLFGALGRAKVPARSPAMAFWHSTPAMLTDETVDAAAEIEPGKTSLSGLSVLEIPETEVASVVHTGPFSEFRQCHVALSEWLAENGFRLEGAYREIYHTCPSDEATTEVQYPIVKDQ